MADDAHDAGKGAAQAVIDAVHRVMHLRDGEFGPGAAMIGDDEAGHRLAHAHIVEGEQHLALARLLSASAMAAAMSGEAS
jgi:hypothetical protein